MYICLKCRQLLKINAGNSLSEIINLCETTLFYFVDLICVVFNVLHN